MLARRIAALCLVITSFAACTGAAQSTPATPGPTPAASSPATSPAASAATSPASSPAPAALSALAGKWTVAATNPRVLLATGGAAGGTVSIDGTRYTFQAGSYKSSAPVDFAGEITLDCNTTRCRISGSNLPLTPSEIRVVDGRLVVVSSATLKPYGTSNICGHPNLPGEGVITVSRTTTVDGKSVPAEVTLTGGASGGVGTECSASGYQVAWDLTGTRLPG